MKEEIAKMQSGGWTIFKVINSALGIDKAYIILVSTGITDPIPSNKNRTLLLDLTDKTDERYLLLEYNALSLGDKLYALEQNLSISKGKDSARNTDFWSDIIKARQDLVLAPIRNIRSSESGKDEKKSIFPIGNKENKPSDRNFKTKSTKKFRNELAKANLENQIKRNILGQSTSLGSTIPFIPRIVNP